MTKITWFTNIVLLKFYLGPVEVRLELERKATYLGLWWQTKRRKLHVYVAFLVMVQLHLVLPARPEARASGAPEGQTEGEGDAQGQDAPDPVDEAAHGAEAAQRGLPEGEGGEADVTDPQTTSTT